MSYRRASAGSFSRAVLMIVVVAAVACGLPRIAFAETLLSSSDTLAPGLGYSQSPSSTEPYAACPPPTKEKRECFAIVVPGPAAIATAESEYFAGRGPAPKVVPDYEGSGIGGGIGPGDLISAYNLPEEGEANQTVAVVDAYDDPNAESDLAIYREENHLPACTKVGGCFRKVNQEGVEGEYPSSKYPHENWGVEISLDLDVVSATCRYCKILLVEANNPEKNPEGIENLYLAENTAVAKGATEISNSWGGLEEASETKDDGEYFKHPGIPITAGAGDSGYGVSYPAASPDVISVGGTALEKSSDTRGWSEQVWPDSGGGCSAFEERPPWQTKELTGEACPARLDNDVAADASGRTPVTAYDSWETGCPAEKITHHECWFYAGGTSVAAPIVAGAEALSSSSFRKEGPEAFYTHQGSTFDVTWGNNGICSPPAGHEYLCTAGPGYDGPTGNGTPDVKGITRPSTATGATTDVAEQQHEVNLHGSVNPEGRETHYHLEYGLTTAYGKTAPATEASVPAGTSDKAITQTLTGIVTGATYHYRLVASNSSGTTDGEDRTFSTTRWSAQPAPDPVDESSGAKLQGVSCSGSSACTAVGRYESSSSPSVTLAERWNGSEWTLQTTVNPEKEEALNGVSCPSASACTAVGWENKKGELPLVEHWSGSEWATQAAPAPAGAGNAALHNVSCVSTSACAAVGDYENSSHLWVTLAERWNGTEWSIQSTPNPSGATTSVLEGVSCSAASACTAVGYYYPKGGGEEQLAERWNGSEWSIQSTPGGRRLAAVVCTSATLCTAVGEAAEGIELGTKSLAERWDGSEWSIQATPSLSEDPTLTGLSCTSSSACTAVGQYLEPFGNGGEEVTLVENWNGSEWAVEPTPVLEEPAKDKASTLATVSCTTAIVCVAVGQHVEISEKPGVLVERRVAATPDTETEPATSLSKTAATLNGVVDPEGGETTYYFEYGKTLSYGTKTAEESAGSEARELEKSKAISGLEPETTYHFRSVAHDATGTTHGADRTFTTSSPTWSLKSTPAPSSSRNAYLWANSCTSSAACTAVGQYQSESSSIYTAFAERWNGSEWTRQTPAAPTGAKESYLSGVACTSSTACAAAGYYEASSGVYETLAEIWTGTEWKVQSPPNPSGSLASGLSGISCTAASACTAVGEYESSAGVDVPFAERWNGSEWTLQSTPNPTGAKESGLSSVACTTTTACSAVGDYKGSAGTYVPFGETWNGSEWALKTISDPSGATEGQMRGISCTAASACTAVGTYKNSSGAEEPLAERWNGTSWSVQTTSEATGTKANELDGVACTSTTACIAVGVSTTTSGKDVTLAERWNGTSWSVQTTPDNERGEGWLSGGVSCTTSTSCSAVGGDSSGNGDPLAESYG